MRGSLANDYQEYLGEYWTYFCVLWLLRVCRVFQYSKRRNARKTIATESETRYLKSLVAGNKVPPPYKASVAIAVKALAKPLNSPRTSWGIVSCLSWTSPRLNP